MSIKTIDYYSKTVKEDFIKSIKETGFGILVNTDIPKRLMFEVYRSFEEFFHDELKKYSKIFSDNTQEGYYPMLSEKAKDYNIKDLKEFYHFYPHGTNGDPISVYTKPLTDRLESLGAEILTWLQEAYPCQSSFNWKDSVKNSPATLFRVIHYPSLDGKEESGAVRAAAHEDINFITLLVSSTQAGLQAKDKDGNWHDVGTDNNAIIVNVGDMLDMVTKGYYPSTTHRVINPVGYNISRYSAPLFIHPISDTQLSDDKTAKQYLSERLAELGLKK
jgi:isopenicillin N synthase-like dioxygenase